MSSKKLTPAELRQKRLDALGKKPSSTAPPPSTPSPLVVKSDKAKLMPLKREAIRLARQQHKDFNNKSHDDKKKIVKEIYKQLKKQNASGSKPSPILNANDKKKKKRVHWQNGRNNGPLPSQETDGKGYKEKNQQHAIKTMQLLAQQMAKDQQEQENGMMAIDLQQNEWKQLDARNNEQKAIELQEQFNGERAQEVENAANAENQQPRRGCRPGLGCRPDSENATNIAMSAALGAAWGTYVDPVLGTGIGACVGAACGVGKAVHRRFTGRGRKSRKKRGRKHKRKTRKHKKKHRRRKSTHKHKKKRKKRRTTKKR